VGKIRSFGGINTLEITPIPTKRRDMDTLMNLKEIRDTAQALADRGGQTFLARPEDILWLLDRIDELTKNLSALHGLLLDAAKSMDISPEDTEKAIVYRLTREDHD
jgi:hypothetical protein